jgi:hypothetical protein
MGFILDCAGEVQTEQLGSTKFNNMLSPSWRAGCEYLTLKLLSCTQRLHLVSKIGLLGGRVCVASGIALAIERAREMITFCFNSRAQKDRMDDLDLPLDTIGQGAAH